MGKKLWFETLPMPTIYRDCLWEVHTYAGWPGWTGNQGCDPDSRCCPAGCPRMALRLHKHQGIQIP